MRGFCSAALILGTLVDLILGEAVLVKIFDVQTAYFAFRVFMTQIGYSNRRTSNVH